MLRRLTALECADAMDKGDFSLTIRNSAPSVAIVMTQSWCPQWHWMRSFLGDLDSMEGVDIFWIEYDREPFFEAFMNFKETTYRNYTIPYVRYHADGKFLAESNYIDKGGFLRALGRK